MLRYTRKQRQCYCHVISLFMIRASLRRKVTKEGSVVERNRTLRNTVSVSGPNLFSISLVWNPKPPLNTMK